MIEGRTSLRGLYVIGITSTAIGIAVVMILNMATPLEYILDQMAPGDAGMLSRWGGLLARRLMGLLFLVVLSCSILCLLLRHILKRGHGLVAL